MIKSAWSILRGFTDYHRFPSQRSSWGGPFNGQIGRRMLFDALFRQLRPACILETGTYRGTTTEFMVKSGIPIYSIEAQERNYGFSQARFCCARGVHLYLGDSRTVLGRLFASRLKAIREDTVFAYLDAHWNADLPLREELEIIYDHCPAAVVMIDDFQVPFDPGYAYDDYGPGKCLVPDYISSVLSSYGLEIFYPSTPSSQETGEKRGCVVLAGKHIHGDSLRGMHMLRQVDEDASVDNTAVSAVRIR